MLSLINSESPKYLSDSSRVYEIASKELDQILRKNSFFRMAIGKEIISGTG